MSDVTRLIEEAQKGDRKAADAGNAMAMNGLACMYETGHAVPKDFAQAMIWFRKSADGGNVSSMYHIAVLYENGQGVTRDQEQARSWYQKAADLGDDGAKKWLAAHGGK